MGMSCGGWRQGDEISQFDQQIDPDGCAVAGGSGPASPPSKIGDLSNVSKINKAIPMTFGPSSVFAGPKDTRHHPEFLTHTYSSSNLFSGLNSEIAAQETANRPPSRNISDSVGQYGVPESPAQRKRLKLLPRSKLTKEEEEPEAISETDAKTKIDEDTRALFSVRNLWLAEAYFTTLTSKYHFLLINNLVTFAIESKEADARLVGNLFSRAVSNGLCSPASFEEGFSLTAEVLDGIATDAPRAYHLMAIMMKGSGLDKDVERKTRIAAKFINGDKLVALQS